MWYWEYIVTVYIDGEEERSGITTGKTFVDAAQGLYDFYGEDITNILTLKPIFEGTAFEFWMVEEDGECDFEFIRKNKKE